MEIREVKLGDVAAVKGGKRLPKGTSLITAPNNHPYIRVRDLNERRTIELDSSFEFVDDETQKTISRYTVDDGDIVLSIVGTIGLVAIVGKSLDKANLTENCVKLTSLSGIDRDYLYYFLKSSFGQQEIARGTVGAVQAKLPIKNIQDITILLPDELTQRKIAAILASMDEKIEINQKINDNLQQQAELLYHERFETADRSNLPVGWRIVRLGDVATISKKSFNPAKEPEMLLEHYSIPAFDEAHFPVFELSTAIKSNKFVVDNTCFMISKLNPTTKRVWKPYCLTENAVCSTEFIVYKANRQEITDFLYSVIDSSSFSDFMCSHVTGSTGSRQRTTPSDTLAFELILPTAEEIAEYQGIVSPMFEQIKCNAIENDELKRLRDSLLPKLMSGEIDVSSIQL